MHVAVLGAGSLGSLIGGLLAPNHQVTLVGRDDHMRAVASSGLRITGEINRTVHPAATTSWSAVGDPDVGILTVKSYDTQTAASEMRTNPPPTILSLQNGLGNVERIRAGLGVNVDVLVGVATYGAILDEPGVVQCTGDGTITLGSPDGSRSPTAEHLARMWTSSTLDCRNAVDMPRRCWEKVAVNAAINPITALARVSNGWVLEDPLHPVAVAAAREVAHVASANGHALDPEATVKTMESVARQTRRNESSMARDVRTSSRTEIDAITGAVIDRADPNSVPVNRILYGLLAGYEMGAGIRSQ